MRTHIRVAALAALMASRGVHAQTSASITADDLRRRVSIFADDSMRGRATGTRGFIAATDYIARELTRLKLTTGGDKFTYFQNVPLDRVSAVVSMAQISSGVSLKPGIDFIPLVPHFGLPVATETLRVPPSHLAFLGPLGEVRDEDLASPESTIYVVQPPRRGVTEEDYQIWNTTGLIEKYRGANALLIETLDITPASVLARLAAPGIMLRPPIAVPLTVGKLPPPPPLPPVFLISRAAAGMLKVAPLHRGDARFQSTIAPLAEPSRNVVAMIEGSKHPATEVIVLSAHADHLGIVPPALREGRDSIMNGADVSGSGSMALLEIAEYIALLPRKPERTILFLWTTGGEEGMLGAQWFANHIDPRIGTIVANINVDAVARGGAADISGGGPDYVRLSNQYSRSSGFGNWVDAFARKPEFGWRIDSAAAQASKTHSSCAGDHWIFARNGFPSVFVTTGAHPDTRAVTDAPSTLDYPKAARVTKFIADMALALADLPRVPELDTGLLPCGGP